MTSQFNTLQSGNIDIKFNPGDNVTNVYDNYILTENRPLEGEPFNITSTYYTNGILYKISSTIVNNILIPVSLDTGKLCDDLATLEIRTKDGLTYNSGYTCLNGIVTIQDVSLNYSTSSNELILYYKTSTEHICEDFYSTGSTFFDFLIILIIVAVGGYLVLLLMGDGEIDLTTIGIMVLISSLVIIFGMVIINSMSRTC